MGDRALSSPVVLITGALTGIGRAAAVIFAQEGARVVVSGRRDKQGQELVAELQALGAEAIFVRTDVRKEEDVRNLVDETVKRFGPRRPMEAWARLGRPYMWPANTRWKE